MNIREHHLVTQFLDRVCTRVRSKHCADEIRRELLSHIEDAVDARVQQGETIDQAITNVVQQFGEPRELGISLNKVHHPLHQIPLLQGVALLSFVLANHCILFGGHIGQMLEPKAFSLTMVLGLALTVFVGKNLEWRAALKSIFLPPSELPRTERVHAWHFFDRLSRIIQRLSIIVGIFGVAGMIVVFYVFHRANVIGAWLAMAWLAYFYGLVFGVLMSKLHAVNLRTAHRADSRVFQSRLTSEKVSILVQGLTPVLVIQALIGVISHVDAEQHTLIISELTKIAYGLFLSIALVGTLPMDKQVEQNTSGFGVIALRLKRSAPIYLSTPVFAAVSVAMVLLAVWE